MATATHIDDLAFNYALVALNHAQPNTDIPQYLFVKNQYKRRKKDELIDNMIADGTLTCPNLAASAEEMGTTGTQHEGCSRVLWVGIRPAPAAALTLASLRANGGAMTVDGAQVTLNPKGFSIDKIASASAYPQLQDCTDAVRVVVAVEGKLVSFYGLFNQTHGLCEAVNIEPEEVFFFSHYRIDSLTSTSQRRLQWSKKIKAFLEGPSASSRQLDSVATSSIKVDPKISLAHEIATLVYASSAATSSAVRNALLLRILDLAQQMEPDAEEWDSSGFTAIDKLLDLEHSLTQTECHDVVDQVEDCWPDLKNFFDVACVVEMDIIIRESGVVIPYRLLRPYMVVAARNFREGRRPDPNAVLEHIRQLFGPPGPCGPASPSAMASVLAQQGFMLDGLRQTFEAQLAGLRDAFGGKVTATSTLESAWSALASASDQDSAKAYANDIYLHILTKVKGFVVELQEGVAKVATHSLDLAREFRGEA